MKVVAKLAPKAGQLELLDSPMPPPAPGEALVKITSAGICGTDVAIWQWKEAVVGQYNAQFPLIVGHEMAGIIERSSQNPGALPAGTLVAINPQLVCKKCFYCLSGRQTNCPERKLLGGSVNGGWAEYLVIPEENLFALPDTMAAEDAAIFEPLTVATHAVVERVPPRLGETVLIQGCGPIGLLTLILARHAGAKKVFITGLDRDKSRLQLAEELGGTPINVSKDDAVDIVRSEFPAGVDIVYETSGSAAVFDQAIQITKPGGKIALIGLSGVPATMNTSQLVIREVELIGSRGYNESTFYAALKLLDQVADDIVKVISHRLPLKDFGKALELITAENNTANKVLLIPEH
ncbi:MAG: alcohol dehydrogenase catalytic domain-containing protein [Microbacteriaceae bacterium]